MKNVAKIPELVKYTLKVTKETLEELKETLKGMKEEIPKLIEIGLVAQEKGFKTPKTCFEEFGEKLPQPSPA